MLSDREKLILHFVSIITISRYDRLHSCLNCGYQRDLIHPGTGRENRDAIINGMIEDVRRHRCRSIAPEDVEDILEEINEEMICGKIMFQHLVEDQISSTYCPVFDGTGRMVQKSDDTEPCITCGKSKKDHNFEEMSDCEWSMTGERPNKNTNWRDMR